MRNKCVAVVPELEHWKKIRAWHDYTDAQRLSYVKWENRSCLEDDSSGLMDI